MTLPTSRPWVASRVRRSRTFHGKAVGTRYS
ncbi:hypothetical protein A2U01_0098512, partial [Trifolium medium]|nr:hypothetical protein [Trifolium medium]